jgi:hypothetical protein
MKVYLFIVIFFISLKGFSQSPLMVTDNFWSGIEIYQNGTKISISDAKKIAKGNDEVVKKLSAAQTNRTIGKVISYPASFTFGYVLGQSLAGNSAVKPNWTVGGIGAAAMIIGILIEGRGNKQLKEAVDNYNASISKSTGSFKPTLSIASSEYGIGVALHF